MRILVALVLMASLLPAPGCGTSSYSRLRSEDSIPELAELKARTLAVGNHTTLVPTGGDGLRVAVHEIGPGDRGRVLVMLHGVLSDHRAWRFVVGELAETYDLMLVDLPGCGQSDKPDPELLGDAGYSPEAMAGRVLEAVRSRLGARAANRDAPVTFVAHSLGGAVTLRMFCSPELAALHAPLLSRVDGLVLLSPMDIHVPRPDPELRRLAEVTGAELVAADAFGVLRKKVADATHASTSSPDRALREEADTRLLYLRDRARRRAAQAMLVQAVPWKAERPDWAEIEPVESEYCRVDLPALILWGRRDETLPVAMGYKLAAELPRARLLALPNVMHSPHIEIPARCAALIREFVETGAGLASGGH